MPGPQNKLRYGLPVTIKGMRACIFLRVSIFCGWLGLSRKVMLWSASTVWASLCSVSLAKVVHLERWELLCGKVHCCVRWSVFTSVCMFSLSRKVVMAMLRAFMKLIFLLTSADLKMTSKCVAWCGVNGAGYQVGGI